MKIKTIILQIFKFDINTRTKYLSKNQYRLSVENSSYKNGHTHLERKSDILRTRYMDKKEEECEEKNIAGKKGRRVGLINQKFLVRAERTDSKK